MVLTRLGNKRKMHSDLAKNFPDHNMRIELFFGAGGSFFYLPKPKYSIVNDLDDDVFNLYMVIKNNLEDFRKEIQKVPLTESLILFWKKNKEQESIMQAVRFLFLSNFTYMGKGDALRLGLDNSKQIILNNLDKTFELLQDVKIMNRDFRDVLPRISFTKGLNDKEKCFIYMDPVYLDTEHYYKVPDWSETDTIDCLDIMINSGIKCAMSEFDHPLIISEAKKRDLNIIFLKSRANIKNRRNEILITNYTTQIKLF